MSHDLIKDCMEKNELLIRWNAVTLKVFLILEKKEVIALFSLRIIRSVRGRSWLRSHFGEVTHLWPTVPDSALISMCCDP